MTRNISTFQEKFGTYERDALNQQLCYLMQAGDESAFNTFFDVNYDWMYRKASRMFKDAGEAQRAVSWCCVQTWRHFAPKYKPENPDGTPGQPFATWLNYCVDLEMRKMRFRLQKAEHIRPFHNVLKKDGKDILLRLPCYRKEPLAEIIEAETAERINSAIEWALEQLTPKQRLAFVLQYIEGYKQKQVARILKCAKNHASVLAYRAKKRMRQLIREYAVGCEILDPIIRDMT